MQRYFDATYAVRDPYGTRCRWYERRKRQILLNALPRATFGNAFEPACGTGELTRELAARCAHVLASDFCDDALVQAREGLRQVDNVTLGKQQIPLHWPAENRLFDLIVVSEVCSFLGTEEIETLASRCTASLRPEGILVVCDWRWPFDARVSSAEFAHAVFDAAGVHRLVSHEEKDFLLGVWGANAESVAQREGIA